jgi:hypothetical protein
MGGPGDCPLLRAKLCSTLRLDVSLNGQEPPCSPADLADDRRFSSSSSTSVSSDASWYSTLDEPDQPLEYSTLDEPDQPLDKFSTSWATSASALARDELDRFSEWPKAACASRRADFFETSSNTLRSSFLVQSGSVWPPSVVPSTPTRHFRQKLHLFESSHNLLVRSSERETVVQAFTQTNPTTVSVPAAETHATMDPTAADVPDEPSISAPSAFDRVPPASEGPPLAASVSEELGSEERPLVASTPTRRLREKLRLFESSHHLRSSP